MIEKTDKGPEPISREPASSLDQDSMVGLEKALTHFVKSFESSAQRWEEKVYPFVQSFEASAKRWERMVYPAIFIFGLLGISGFWLIYSLTQDMHACQGNLGINYDISVARQMNNHIASMDTSMGIMQPDISSISTRLDTMPPLLFKISEMNESIKSMTISTGVMSRDMGVMNNNVSRPMSFMNSFAPW